MTHCTFCRRDGHLKNDCPEVGLILVRTDDEPPSTGEDALQGRNLALRAALRAVVVEGRRAGIVYSPETAALLAHADSFDP